MALVGNKADLQDRREVPAEVSSTNFTRGLSQIPSYLVV